ncbi:hypothetical protein OG978_30995 [Streptomyces sp. NBC_01591]|uniref:hypothetical protein n=1 Tax=Streptomyces sp. NBC_01591 TaxID=2975888 RepID=UPI002DD81DD9|nr:hypothetical protein [Streptomyces sp. NBC_01591]WSD71424.1 hypothetical protein OG978_30995 [Streptomyces sp. NBC_01591]
MVSDSSGAKGPAAEWAVLGKHPGRSMGYEVLAGSLPAGRAQRYLWSATTGTPDARDPASGLPWRVFLSGADRETGSVCAVVDTSWDGSKDGTGAPSYTWRLLLLEWDAASRAGVTWTALDRAVSRDGSVSDPEAAAVTAVRTPAADLAGTVDRLGFEWAAGMAALLLDGRQLVITPPPGGTVPDVAERVRMLDAVCSLLPYGCRAWLSGATWTGKAEHGLRLVFAASARTGQQEVPLRTGRPPAPQGEAARTYLAELLRVRAKRESTTEVVAHLLAATAAVPLHESAVAVRVLQELDLLDSVLNDIRRGRGRVDDVQRLLDLQAVGSLDEQRLGVVVTFLAGCARRPDGGAARAVLTRHWTPLVPELLAADVVARAASKETLTLARGYLDLLRGLEVPHPGSFERLFTVLAATEGYDPAWVGSLAYMVENEFGHISEAVDRTLVDSREAGLAWLRVLLQDRVRDLRPLSRLVALTESVRVESRPGWLRFAGVLTGHFGPAEVFPADAAEFAAGHEDAWRIALETARQHGRPAVVGLLWDVLRQVVGSGRQREVLPLLDALVPPGAPDLPPDAAADADLLRVLAGLNGADSRLALSMPRLRRLTTDRAGLDAYATTIVRRTEGDPELKDRVVEALLGDEPDPGNSWAVLSRWIRQRPSTEATVRDGLALRLNSADYSRWIGLDLPQDLVDGLAYRSDLGWLRPVRRLRVAAEGRAELSEIGRIIADACPDRRFPGRLLDEIASLMGDFGPWFAFNLTTELDRRLHGLGFAVYEALGSSTRHREVRDQLVRFSADEESRHRRILGALRATGHSYDRPPQPPVRRPSPAPPAGAAPGAGPTAPPPTPQAPGYAERPDNRTVAQQYQEGSQPRGLLKKFKNRGRT